MKWPAKESASWWYFYGRAFAPGTVLDDVPESGTTARAPLIDQQTPLWRSSTARQINAELFWQWIACFLELA
jgi:hypothetical protein